MRLNNRIAAAKAEAKNGPWHCPPSNRALARLSNTELQRLRVLAAYYLNENQKERVERELGRRGL